ncbi:MAG: chorismate synthase [Sphingobacteriales bacterium]|nr:MAG: chorismate synthase [Sphingobacteriales bacterium]
MNSFGRMFRIHIFGESHGPSVGITIDCCPAGIAITEADFLPDLQRRKPGAAGTTPRQEEDMPEIISGMFQNKSTGAPITIIFRNNNTRSTDYEALRDTPRPGHADFVLHEKYNGYNDYRGGGHSSGRLTLALVAAGVVAKKILSHVNINAQLVEAGGNRDIEAAIAKAVEEQDSIGGVVECRALGLPVGLGEPFFDSVESVISHLAFSIPAIKGVEFGSGMLAARMKGSEHNDAIIDAQGTTKTNHAGGINGGITNGNELVFRIAVKPTSSTPKQQETWNNKTQSVEAFAVKGRHDLCIALRVPVVVEAIAAIALADLSMIYATQRSMAGNKL